jgi:hypothetical protein
MGIMSRCVRRHARSLSMRMLVDIERFSISVNCPPVLRNVTEQELKTKSVLVQDHGPAHEILCRSSHTVVDSYYENRNICDV